MNPYTDRIPIYTDVNGLHPNGWTSGVPADRPRVRIRTISAWPFSCYSWICHHAKPFPASAGLSSNVHVHFMWPTILDSSRGLLVMGRRTALDARLYAVHHIEKSGDNSNSVTTPETQDFREHHFKETFYNRALCWDMNMSGTTCNCATACLPSKPSRRYQALSSGRLGCSRTWIAFAFQFVLPSVCEISGACSDTC